MANILGVGIATLDIINTIDGYPAENDEIRAIDRVIKRGGNATNTLAVLSQLGHSCAWSGVMADTPDASYIWEDLEKYHIDRQAVHIHANGSLPTSYILLNRQNGSRTIVHYRNLPEYTFEDFKCIDLRAYDWIHFEGRNIETTNRMLAYARNSRPDAPLSVEIEKPREGISQLFDNVSVLFFSQGYAQHCGFNNPRDFLNYIHMKTTASSLVCTWGDHGAAGMDSAKQIYVSPAFPPPHVKDTIAAGDTFNAGFIDARLRNLDFNAALESACRLAGKKCGRFGIDGLMLNEEHYR